MQGLIQIKNRVTNLDRVDAFLFTPSEDGKPANLTLFIRQFHQIQFEGEEAEEAWAWIQNRCILRLGVTEEVREVDERGQPVTRPTVKPDQIDKVVDAPCFARPPQDPFRAKAAPARFVKIRGGSRLVNVSEMAIVAKTKHSDTVFGIHVTWRDGRTSSFGYHDARTIWDLFARESLDFGDFRVNVSKTASAARGHDDLGLPFVRLNWGADFEKDFSGAYGEKIWEAVSEGSISPREMAKEKGWPAL